MATRLLLVVAGLVAALTQDVQFRAGLLSGDVFRLEIVRSVDDSTRQEANFSTTTTVRVSVLSVGPSGFVLEWRPGGTVLRGAPGGPEMKTALATILTNDTAFRFALDPDARFRSLTNAAELEPKLAAARDALLAKPRAALRPDEETFDDLRKSLTPASIEGIAIHDLKIYTNMFGGALPAGGVLETTATRMSPFSRKPVPAVNVVRLESATPDLAVISRTTTLHSDTVNVMVPAKGCARRADIALTGAWVWCRSSRWIRSRQTEATGDSIDW